MKMQRLTALVVVLAALIGVSSVAGTIATSGAATSAHAARAQANSAKKKHKKKHHKKKHQKKCPPKTKKKKNGVCVKTKVRTEIQIQTKENTTLAAEEAKKRTAAEEAKAAAEKKTAEEAAAKKVLEEAAAKQKKEAEEAAAKKKKEEEEKLSQQQAIGKGACEAGSKAAIEKASEIPVSPAFTAEQLNAEPCGNYLSSEGGTSGDHFSQLKEITPSNAASLKAVWLTQLDGAGLTDASVRHGGEMASVEYDGVLYYSTGTDDIFAVSVASGNILWVHPGELPDNFTFILNGGGNRGLSLGEGKIYSAVLSGDVEALNQKTGALEWRTQIGSPSEGVSVTASPLYYDGMVIIAPVGGEEGVRGFVEALSAKTGELIWKHYNVPAPGEFGHESWPTASSASNCPEARLLKAAAEKAKDSTTTIATEERKGLAVCNSEWERGGAVVWFAPTVDDHTGDLYYGTSNAAEDYYGENRNGANLWNCSTLALNAETGELVWGFQEVHHDVWDDDQGNQPDMADLNIGGKETEAVISVDKAGLVYALNAATGVPLSIDPVAEVEVPTTENASFRTQPIPAIAMHPYEKPTAATLAELQAELNTSEATYNKAAEEGKEPTGVLGTITVKAGGAEGRGILTPPRALGEGAIAEVTQNSGVQYAVSSFDPENGTFIMDGNGAGMTVKLEEIAPQTFVEGSKWEGVHSSKISAAAPAAGKPGATYAVITADDMDTGKELWQINDNQERKTNGTVVKETTGLESAAHVVGNANAGTTQTAGGVTFLGNAEGEEVALESATGKLLWRWELGDNIAASASVYEWNGHEYVTVFTSEGGDAMWTFGLNGTIASQYKDKKSAAEGGLPVPALGEHGYNPAAVEVSAEFLAKGPLPEACAVGTCASHEGKEK